MVLGFSTLLALVFLLAAAPGLAVRDRSVTRTIKGWCLVALVQWGSYAWRTCAAGATKGFRDASGNALSLIVGSFWASSPGIPAIVSAAMKALCLASALVPALVVPAGISLIAAAPSRYVISSPPDNGLAGQLSKFTLMALITAMMPVAYVMMPQTNWPRTIVERCRSGRACQYF